MNTRLSESELQLFELLRNDKLEDYKVYTKRTNKNIFRGIIEKYPESAHFIYELIQNADDAKATNVEIFLYRDKLVFKHDGKKHLYIESYTLQKFFWGHFVAMLQHSLIYNVLRVATRVATTRFYPNFLPFLRVFLMGL